MMMAQSMQGKCALVSGAGTGIGRGVALALAQAGADVVLHYSHSAAGANAAAAEITALGRRAHVSQADFTKLDEVQRLAAEAEAAWGRIDVLVNNAGVTMNRPFLEVTPEQFDTLYNINIRAMFFLTQAITQRMIERGHGAVVNLTSVHAFHGMTEHTVYAGTKGAIVAFTRVVALELAPHGVRVNAIAPGWVVVDNHFKAIADLDLETAAESIPAGFVGQPSDVGELAVFLASDAARYIVGQTLTIDGGQMSIMPNTGDFRAPRPWQFGQGYVPGL